MRPTQKLAALLLTLALPAVAGAQPVTLPNPGPSGELAFDSHGRTMGGSVSRKQAVLRSQAELDAFFDGRAPADLASVDWTRQQVAAVSMGTQSSGGHFTKVAKIYRMPGRPSSPPIPGGPIGGITLLPGKLTVSFTESHPAPGTPVLTVITTPWAAAVMQRTPSDDIIDFNHVSPSGRNFSLVALDLISAAMGGSNRNIQIQADGAVDIRITNGSVAPPAGNRTVSGKATSAELRSLEDAVKLAQLASVPDPLPGPAGSLTPVNRFILTVKSDDARHVGQTRGRLSTLGGFEAQLRPLIDLTTKIANRIQAPAPTGRNFTLAQLETTINGFAGPSTSTYAVQADGTVEVKNYNPLIDTGPPPVKRGKATAAELAEIENAVKLANMETVPARVSGPPAGGFMFILVVKSDDVRHEGQTAGQLHQVRAPYEARLRPLLDVLEKIGRRIQQNPTSGIFTSASLTSRIGSTPVVNPNPGPSPALRLPGPSLSITQTVAVQADGAVSVQRSHPLIRFKELKGTATRAELRTLEDAINKAELSSMPNPLDVMYPMHLPASPFSVTVDSDDPKLAGETSGHRNFLGHYGQKLAPVLQALEAIAKRLRDAENPQPTVRTVSGTIDVRGWWGFRTVHLVDGNESYQVKPESVASQLRQFEGEVARVRGKVADVEAGKFIVTVDSIVSPRRQKLSGPVTVLNNGDVEIEAPWVMPLRTPGAPIRRPLPFPNPNMKVECFGPAVGILRKAGEAYATVDAYVFRSDMGRPERAYVVGVKGKAEAGAKLRRRGHRPEALAEGTEFMISRLSRSKKSMRVELKDGREGWVRVDKVDLGPRRLHAGPTPFPPVTIPQPVGGSSGITGSSALGGN